MNLVIDACSAINLANADAFRFASNLKRCSLWITPVVRDVEANSCKIEIKSLLDAGFLREVDEHLISVSTLEKVFDAGDLGEGETESIAACNDLGFSFCCDDKKARELAKDFLGETRVIGTIRLLRWCVEEQLINCVDAFKLFRKMKELGGFLPRTQQTFFCADLDRC